MARFDQRRVPRGTSRKWEIVIDDDRPKSFSEAATAADVKPQHRLLRDIETPQLAAIPLLPRGAELARGERYLDLHDPARGEFVGNGYEQVRPGQRVIARSSAPQHVWRALIDAAERVLGRLR